MLRISTPKSRFGWSPIWRVASLDEVLGDRVKRLPREGTAWAVLEAANTVVETGLPKATEAAVVPWRACVGVGI